MDDYYEDDYISERERITEEYGNECVCCGQKLDCHDNNTCDEINS